MKTLLTFFIVTYFSMFPQIALSQDTSLRATSFTMISMTGVCEYYDTNTLSWQPLKPKKPLAEGTWIAVREGSTLKLDMNQHIGLAKFKSSTVQISHPSQFKLNSQLLRSSNFGNNQLKSTPDSSAPEEEESFIFPYLKYSQAFERMFTIMKIDYDKEEIKVPVEEDKSLLKVQTANKIEKIKFLYPDNERVFFAESYPFEIKFKWNDPDYIEKPYAITYWHSDKIRTTPLDYTALNWYVVTIQKPDIYRIKITNKANNASSNILKFTVVNSSGFQGNMSQMKSKKRTDSLKGFYPTDQAILFSKTAKTTITFHWPDQMGSPNRNQKICLTTLSTKKEKCYKSKEGSADLSLNGYSKYSWKIVDEAKKFQSRSAEFTLQKSGKRNLIRLIQSRAKKKGKHTFYLSNQDLAY